MSADTLAPAIDMDPITVYEGDCREVMAALPAESVDAIVTDPPYGLHFMGRDWDGFGTPAGFQSWSESWAREALRVLKPGGHLLAFSGTRTYHRMACGVEDAGFEVRDMVAWLYGSGFPKSLDVAKAIDKRLGAEGSYGAPKSEKHAGHIARGRSRGDSTHPGWRRPWFDDPSAVERQAREYLPGTGEAAAWKGWGTALKPGYEPIILARKPLAEGTVAAQVLAHGTGALNIDACRIEVDGERPHVVSIGDLRRERVYQHGGGSRAAGTTAQGRWPANVALDEDAAAMLDAQTGELASNGGPDTALRRGATTGRSIGGNAYGDAGQHEAGGALYGDRGGASRFYYCAKASTSERGEGNTHPTVKPIALMRWLVRLITPPGGIVLDPFAGSGSTLLAARDEGFQAIGIERETEYVEIIARRAGEQLALALT